MSNFYRGPSPSIDASYQVLVYLAKRFQRKRLFRNRPIRNKNCLWWPFLLMDRDKMSNLYRGSSIDGNRLVKWTETWHEASMEYTLLRLHILSRSVNKHGCHRQFLFLIGWFLKNLLLWNRLAKWTETWCLLTDRDKMCNLNRVYSIDASCQVSVHLTKRFQRRRFFLIDQSETRIACGGSAKWTETWYEASMEGPF
jgi:hypothetical protein